MAKVPPATWDWRAAPCQFPAPRVSGGNYCTPVLNQRSARIYCGSCWGFAAVSAVCDRMEIMHRAAGMAQPQVMLSVQVLLNCVPHAAATCDGGNVARVFQYMQEHGLPSESCAAYVGEPLACTPMNTCKSCQRDERNGGYVAVCHAIEAPKMYFIEGHSKMVDPTPAQIMHEVYWNGPVVAYVNGEPLERYVPGSVYSNSKASKVPDHVVCIVGWGSSAADGDFWIIRNSWGDFWGDGGFGRIQRGTNCLGVESLICAPAPHGWSKIMG